MQPKPLFWRYLLTILLVLAIGRLIGFYLAFGETTLQMDFAAYYTAGEALNRGLSPYRTDLSLNPPLWDGECEFQHSRFLYPPLVASLFQPIALIPYHTAKYLWMLIITAALVAALWLFFVTFRLKLKGNSILFFCIFVCVYYPLLTILERGQIDSVVLLFIATAIFLLVRKRSLFLAGMLLSTAILLKMHCLYLVPFLALRRQWKAIWGCILGGIILILATIVLNGPDMLIGYLTEELPRISRYGEGGTEQMKLPLNELAEVRMSLPLDSTAKGGEFYQRRYVLFEHQATLVRTPVGSILKRVVGLLGFTSSLSIISVLLFLGFFAICFFLFRLKNSAGLSDRPDLHLIYWQLVIVTILITAPVTWVMNTIWLLPVCLILMQQYNQLRNREQILYFLLCSLGLLLATIPDKRGFFMLTVNCWNLFMYKYVIAELLIFAGLCGILHRGNKVQEDDDEGRPVENCVIE